MNPRRDAKRHEGEGNESAKGQEETWRRKSERVEFKTLNAQTSGEDAQLLNYLKATGMRVGLLINFGSVGKLEWKRFVR